LFNGDAALSRSVDKRPPVGARITIDFVPNFNMRHTMEPQIAQKAPYPVGAERGKSYHWCACGRSRNQPFCDGSHKGTEFTPVKFEATETKTVYFCGCKLSAGKPLCDGSHKAL
jgi:CDGSH-type Zn-finger protein